MLVSVTPIDPSLPYSAGGAGSHYAITTTSCSLFACVQKNTSQAIPFPLALSYSVDFTDAANNALLFSNGNISPITGTFNLQFGFMTAQSVFTPVNAVSVFQQIFSVPAVKRPYR